MPHEVSNVFDTFCVGKNFREKNFNCGEIPKNNTHGYHRETFRLRKNFKDLLHAFTLKCQLLIRNSPDAIYQMLNMLPINITVHLPILQEHQKQSAMQLHNSSYQDETNWKQDPVRLSKTTRESNLQLRQHTPMKCRVNNYFSIHHEINYHNSNWSIVMMRNWIKTYRVNKYEKWTPYTDEFLPRPLGQPQISGCLYSFAGISFLAK